MLDSSQRQWLDQLERLHAVAQRWYGFEECPECGASQYRKVIRCTTCGYVHTLLASEIERIRVEALEPKGGKHGSEEAQGSSQVDTGSHP